MWKFMQVFLWQVVMSHMEHASGAGQSVMGQQCEMKSSTEVWLLTHARGKWGTSASSTATAPCTLCGSGAYSAAPECWRCSFSSLHGRSGTTCCHRSETRCGASFPGTLWFRGWCWCEFLGRWFWGGPCRLRRCDELWGEAALLTTPLWFWGDWGSGPLSLRGVCWASWRLTATQWAVTRAGPLVLWKVAWSSSFCPWSGRPLLRDPSNCSSIWWNSHHRLHRCPSWSRAAASETSWQNLQNPEKTTGENASACFSNQSGECGADLLNPEHWAAVGAAATTTQYTQPTSQEVRDLFRSGFSSLPVLFLGRAQK